MKRACIKGFPAWKKKQHTGGVTEASEIPEKNRDLLIHCGS